MRRILIASLLLTPALVPAQASKWVSSFNLEARSDVPKLIMPAVKAATPSAAVIHTAIPMVRISTGVKPAVIVQAPTISFTANELQTLDNKVVVRLTVDENGQPQAAEIVKSLNPALDQRVLNAVRQARFRPAQLDEQAVSEHMNLTFVFQK